MTDLLRPREPEWLELAGGVAVHVRPLTSAVMLAARAELRAAGTDLDARIEMLIKALARAAILDWRGVPGGDAETAPVTPGGHRRPVRPLADFRGLPVALLRPGDDAGRGKKRLMARAEWHFGDGPAYCRGCAELGRPCASGGAGDDGHRCPEIETRPADRRRLAGLGRGAALRRATAHRRHGRGAGPRLRRLLSRWPGRSATTWPGSPSCCRRSRPGSSAR